MQVRVLLFASLRDAAGADDVLVTLDTEDSRVEMAAVLNACALQYPALAAWLPHVRAAVNCEYVQSDALVSPDDEIAFIPPVSGGCHGFS